MSSYALCQLVAGPILGRLSDHMGRKPLLIVSQLGTLVGFLIMAASHTLGLVFIARIIDGLTAGNLSLAQAYIADVTTPEKRARSFGLIGIAFGIGFMVGPGISGLLLRFGYAYPILAAAFLSASSVVCTATLLPRVEPHAGRWIERTGRKALERIQLEGLRAVFHASRTGAVALAVLLFRVLVLTGHQRLCVVRGKTF